MPLDATTALGPVEDFVNAYESVRAREPVPISAFLPPRDDSRFLPALAELIRIEMEYAWTEGRPRRLAAYRADYPELFADPSALAPVAFEEYRLRRQAGELVARDEYARDYGIDTSLWPEESGSVRELSQKLAEAETLFPEVGQAVAGFRLERELGRGAFGRVYLARQGDLADRPVALKVAADVGTESRALARLQHTNVMPVYSVHRAGPFQAVCMPFFPAVTLADLCRSLAKRDAVPESGKALLETLKARTALAGQPMGSDPYAPEPPHPAAPPAKPNVDLIAGTSFVRAVLFIGAHIADGLAHAHERGIVHRDLKPANILLTDEGQPLILDFNLAADISPTAEQARAALGGTLPYMPPEHLQAFRDRKPFRDPRGDVYALGLILFELLAGRHPFPVRRGDPDRLLPAMIEDRQRPPSVREYNRAVPRGLEAILCKCMHPDPEKRYANGRELQEDLQRQFDDQSLRYADEPVREVVGKWRRRHPVLASWVTLVALGMGLLVGAGLAVQRAVHKQEVARHERHLALTRDVAQKFHVDFEDVHFRSAFPTPPGQASPDAGRQMQAFRDRWRQIFDANLAAPPWTEALDGKELRRLRREVGDTYYLMADELTGVRERTPAEDLRESLRLNHLAEAAYTAEELPQALFIQRANVYRWLGELDWAAAAEAQAAWTQLKTGHDHLWTARELLETRDGRRRQESVSLLQQAVEADPGDPLIHSHLGYVHLTGRRPAAAIERYGLTIGLHQLRATGAGQRPPVSAYAARGLAHYEAKQFADAERDFTVVIEGKPEFLDGYVSRALMREKQKKYAGALEDWNHVLTKEPGRTDALFGRARVHGLVAADLSVVAGSLAGSLTVGRAAADHEAGLKSTPTTARGWFSRSFHQTDPRAALADIEEALKLEPDWGEALQHKAHVWSEQMPGPATALAAGGSPVWRSVAAAIHRLGQVKGIEALDVLLSRWPEFTPGRAGRAVLLARVGRDAEAVADARAVRGQEPEPDPLFIYQVAGAYALVSRRDPAQRQPALDHLAEAYRRNPFLLSLLRIDADLVPLHPDPEFRTLIGAAEVFRERGAKP